MILVDTPVLSALMDRDPDARLLDWFAATERHPRQLRELDWETYLQMKRMEVRRQQSSPSGRR